MLSLDTPFVQRGFSVAQMCEACHGPGLKHVQAMEASQLQQGIGDEEGRQLIYNPGTLSPGDSVDFCGSCHVASLPAKPAKDHPGAACPVATKACITCHMPRIDIPDMHTAFADHLIRVVRPGGAIPE